jgi:hypothetical protein
MHLNARWRILLAPVIAVAIVGVAVAVTRHAAPPARPVPNHAFGSLGGHGSATVWAVGDGADGGTQARALARRIAAGRPDRVLYLGDVYPAGSAEDFATNFRPVYRGLAPRMAPTPGNHDWPNHDSGYDPYWRRVTGAATPPWYAFRAGGWQLLSLNSEAPHGSGSPQMRWLRARLHGRATCRLAFWHRPRFSAGEHGDQSDIAPLWQQLQGHATLVLSGHDHDLERLRPQHGLSQVVAGAGGHSHYSLDAGDPRLAFGDAEHDGALRLRLSPGRARLAFVTAGGRTLDTASFGCRPFR